MEIKPYIKFMLVLAGLFLLAIIAWQTAFKQTLSLYHENNKLEKLLKSADSLPLHIARLEGSIKAIDKNETKDSIVTGTSLQQQVINFVTNNRNIQLEEASSPVFADSSSYNSETVAVTLSGSFHDLLQLLYEMEFSSVRGRIISSRFELIDILQENRKKLILNLYVQNIKWKKN
jgi:hypothetical protein